MWNNRFDDLWLYPMPGWFVRFCNRTIGVRFLELILVSEIVGFLVFCIGFMRHWIWVQVVGYALLSPVALLLLMMIITAQIRLRRADKSFRYVVKREMAPTDVEPVERISASKDHMFQTEREDVEMKSEIQKSHDAISNIAARTNLSEDAVRVLRDALIRGRGGQAQFDHPELGGMGQWMRGGMVMIGDMNNSALAARVLLACTLLSEWDETREPTPTTSLKWWPAGLGEPSQSASQNGIAYAYFPAHRRLAVRDERGVHVYDLGSEILRGVSGSGRELIVHTENGSNPVHALPVVRIDDSSSNMPKTK